jgi:hypothetical protein
MIVKVIQAGAALVVLLIHVFFNSQDFVDVGELREALSLILYGVDEQEWNRPGAKERYGYMIVTPRKR